MSDVKAFIDTNLLVYLYSNSDIEKKKQVIQAINKYERFVSTQVLNEFCNVCLRKIKLPVQAVKGAVKEITEVCSLVIVDDEIISSALDIHSKYKYSYYDALILASALSSDCKYLLSEDMADGQVIEKRLKILNIFAEKKSGS